jgi:hypothetical protein
VAFAVAAGVFVRGFGRAHRAPYRVSVKSDLRNLNTAMDAYHSSHGAYATDHTLLDFTASPGLTDLSITVHPTTRGWQATAGHADDPELRCSIYMGTAAAEAGVTAGAPQCNR